MVIWSIAFGARSISIYDIRGYIKTHQAELKNRLQKLVNCLHLHPPAVAFHIHWNGVKDDVTEAVNLRLLSKEDGQEDIVQAARKLAQNVANGDMTPDDVNEATLEANLGTGGARLPDPEVLVRFGLAHSNLGYPPWQIRLSEIHDIDTHHGVSRGEFFHVLLKYSKCQQRFGN